MSTQICPLCCGSKKYMTQKSTVEKNGLIYVDCNTCDNNGLVDSDLFIDVTDMDY